MASFADIVPIFPMIASLVSSVASLYLLVWVWKLEGHLARKLMARQLWHLALADVLSTVMTIPWFVLPLWHSVGDLGDEGSAAKWNHSLLDCICLFCHWNNVPLLASVFIEVHICLAAISTILRLPAALRVLSRIIPFVWALSFVVGSAVTLDINLRTGVIPGVFWNPSLGVCEPTFYGENVKAVIMICALALCMATYFAGVLTVARRAGSSVEERVWNRTKLFVIAAVVTWGPFVAYTFYSKATPDSYVVVEDRVFYFVQYTFFISNGLFNAAVYALKSGWMVRTVRRERRLGADHEVSLPLARSGPNAAQYPSGTSFNVAFNSNDDVIGIQSSEPSSRSAASTSPSVLDALPEEQSHMEEDLLACFDEDDEG